MPTLSFRHWSQDDGGLLHPIAGRVPRHVGYGARDVPTHKTGQKRDFEWNTPGDADFGVSMA
jgi:hypothetical protein